jgi:hypothetical protein
VAVRTEAGRLSLHRLSRRWEHLSAIKSGQPLALGIPQSRSGIGRIKADKICDFYLLIDEKGIKLVDRPRALNPRYKTPTSLCRKFYLYANKQNEIDEAL